MPWHKATAHKVSLALLSVVLRVSSRLGVSNNKTRSLYSERIGIIIL